MRFGVGGVGERRVIAPLLAGLLLLGGCTAFEAPRYGGEVADFMGLVELPYDPDTDYEISEQSMSSMTATLALGGGDSRARGSVRMRESLEARLTNAPNFGGYRTSVCIERYRMVPEPDRPDRVDLHVDVREIRFEMQTDHAGGILTLDVDRTSPGWLGLTSEQRAGINEFMDQWRNRLAMMPELPGLYRQGEVRKLDTRDMAADFASNFPAKSELNADIFARAIGLTEHEGARHLVVEYWADVRFAVGPDPGRLDLGGYFLIDMRTGAASFWEEASRLRMRSGPLSIAVDRRGSGIMSRTNGGIACISGSI